MESLSDIMAAVSRERAYQDAKWGQIDHKNPRFVSHYIVVLTDEIEEVVKAFCKGSGDKDALREILQVLSVCCACLQEHGIVERDFEEAYRKLNEANSDKISFDEKAQIMNKSMPGRDRYCEVYMCSHLGPVRFSYKDHVLCDYHAGLLVGSGELEL